MPSLARAAVFTGPDLPLKLDEFPLRMPRGSEILVRVRCCTLCGSDLHTFTGRRSAPVPSILGHEIIGTIDQFGPDATRRDLLGRPLSEGDRITWTLAASCGSCFFCTHELPQKCEHLFKYGHEPLTPDHPFNGGLAECCLLAPGTGVVHLPDDLPDAVACPANCATATVAAALRTAGDCRGQTVLIQGAGMLGLTACALAREAGAASILCCDVRPERLDVALRFGATVVAGAEREMLAEQVREMTAGRGVDMALDFSGSPQAIETGLPLLRIGGRYVWVGAVLPTRAVSIIPETIVRRQLTIRGVHNYAPPDLARAVEFLSATHHKYPFAELMGQTFALAEVNQAFQEALKGTAARVAVQP